MFLQVFGAFVTTEWKKNEVFGSHEMFLFSLYPTPQAFEARPDLNQTYINIKNDQLQIGQGLDCLLSFILLFF